MNHFPILHFWKFGNYTSSPPPSELTTWRRCCWFDIAGGCEQLRWQSEHCSVSRMALQQREEQHQSGSASSDDDDDRGGSIQPQTQSAMDVHCQDRKVLVLTSKQILDVAGGMRVGKDVFYRGVNMIEYAIDATEDAVLLVLSMASRPGQKLTDVQENSDQLHPGKMQSGV